MKEIPRRWAWALIAAVTLAAYLPSLRDGFVWDDDTFLTDNPLIKAPDGLRRFWLTTQAPDYWPVTSSTLWAEWRLWGLNAAGYHATNLLLHIAEAGLIWTILRRLRVPGALCGALLFAVHPVNVESVVWIAQRKNLMAMLLYLASIWAFLKTGIQTKGSGRDCWNPTEQTKAPGGNPAPGFQQSRPDPLGGLRTDSAGSFQTSRPDPFYWLQPDNRWYAVSLAAFVLAMLGKGSVAPLPLVLLGIVAWRRRLEVRDILWSGPFFAVAGGLAAVNVWFAHHTTSEIVRSAGPLERLLGAGAVVWFYLGKALWPANLIFVYPQWRIDEGNLLCWAPLAAAIGVTLVLLSVGRVACPERSRRVPNAPKPPSIPPADGASGALGLMRPTWARALLFTWLYFCVMLVPVMGFTDVYFMKYSLVADHYQHLALIGVTALAGAAWATRLPRRIQPAVAAAAIIILGLLTWRQCSIYRDSETLYRSVLARNPDAWIAHNNLVNILTGTHRMPEAVVQLREALRLRPQDARNQNNLGVALASLGRPADAIAPYQEAVRLQPDSVEFNYNLGLALRQLGRSAEAVSYLETVVRLRPDLATGHLALALALWDAGRRDEAAAQHEEGVRLQAGPSSLDK